VEQMRAFIAIELPEELKQALADIQSRLREGSQAPVKWVDAGGIHLTLKFLGNISPGLVDRITLVLKESARDIAPFRLEATGLGAFPNPRRVQVVWVGVGGEMAPLNRLQQHIEAGLKPLGFTPDNRPFKPHLTLGRVRERAVADDVMALGRLIGEAGFAACPIDVAAVHLMRSELTPQGAVYTRLVSVKLG
jgi:RNA 2',3'-cyclic 3'-phosphodiesterase